MARTLRIGTRDSPLAIWQSTLVKQLLAENGVASEFVLIRSEGDADTTTPLYEMGVQGIFTRALDIALLDERIDVAVHSMKDVPVTLAKGLRQAAVLERGSHKDTLVYKNSLEILENNHTAIIATSSIRRRAQWLHRYPHHTLTTLRGNVNTRLKKLEDNSWDAAIFAAAGLERINLRPETSLDLDWMIPAPAQGAILIVCRENDSEAFHDTVLLNHAPTALCTYIERDFLRTLHGGCSSPVSALALIDGAQMKFTGNITSPDGIHAETVEITRPLQSAHTIGEETASQLLDSGQPWIRQLLKK
jgi:hydroxymethylbilane synthase